MSLKKRKERGDMQFEKKKGIALEVNKVSVG